MGLMNSSQQFQQMMEDRLKSVSDFTTPFIDDILIGTKAEEGEDLCIVQTNMKINKGKNSKIIIKFT